MRIIKLNRAESILLLLVIYGAAIPLSVLAGSYLPVGDPLVRAGIIDLCATVFIFIISLCLNNSSCYDPYWSVAPAVMAGYWIFAAPPGMASLPRCCIMAILILAWSSRLTYNFFRQWRGFIHEDWRYAAWRARAGKWWYWAVSFSGIHLFPTVIVFLACIPVCFAMTRGNRPIGIMDCIAFTATLAAILMEAIADDQLRKHVLSKVQPGKTLQTGLRRYSRHPNYFGEVLFWWGLYFFVLAGDADYWWTIFGPAAVTILFLFISIPLMEKRMRKSRPDYPEYQRRVSVFVPWFPKS